MYHNFVDTLMRPASVSLIAHAPSYPARAARLDQPSALTPPSGPLALTTPIGQETPVP
jgi:hypothetical protein